MPEPICISLNAIVKARASTNGRRLAEVEASNESIDLEGDVILQRALLDSAAAFIARGHIDIDHLSEIGYRIGISNPEAFIIGRPLEVKNLGAGRTGVLCEIKRSADGFVDISKNRYDAFWESLSSDPPVMWRASVYGMPYDDMVSDCRTEKCEIPAQRYLVRGMDWRSLAMTRKPINNAIKGYARIVTAKAMVEEMMKDMPVEAALRGWPTVERPNKFPQAPYLPHTSHVMPKSMNELVSQYDEHMCKDCTHCQGYDGVFNSVKGFSEHYKQCCGAEDDQANMAAHALMYALIRQKHGVL